MNSNPVALLLRWRKFLIAVVDALVSTITLLVSLYAPQHAELIQTIVFVWQAPVALLIAGITIEDAAEKYGAQKLLAAKFGPPDERA